MAEVGTMSAVEDLKNAKVDREGGPEQEAKVKKSKLPPPRTFTLIPEDFFPYVAALTAQDWGHVSLYVYRLNGPRIIRDPSNVDSIDREMPSVPFTEQYLKETQGSGKFEVKLNDTDAKRTVCRMLIDINDPEYPPKFDIRELDIGFKGNRLFVEKLKREGKLSQDGDVIVKNDNADASMADALKSIALKAMENRQEKPGLESQTFSKMMDMMSNASAKSIDIALGQLKGNEKAAADPMMVLIMNFMMKQLELAEKRAEPAKSNGSDPIMALMMKQIDLAEKRAELAEARAVEERKAAEAERNRQHQKDMELLKQRATAADPLDMVEKVMNLKARLGGDEPDGRNWKEKLVDQGFEALPTILTAVQGYANRQTMQQRQPQPQPRPMNQPMQPQPAAQPQPQPQSQPQGVEPMPEPITDPEIAFLLPILQAQGRQLVVAFATDPASGGPKVADMLSLLAGSATYERIARMGRDKILATIALIPEMEADLLKVGTKEMLSDFIDDFCDPDDDPDDPYEPDEVPIPEGRKGPRPVRAKRDKGQPVEAKV